MNLKHYIKNSPFFCRILPVYHCLARNMQTMRIRIHSFRKYRWNPLLRRLAGRRDTKELLAFKDKHKGERAFIIASGPSLREADVMKLKNEVTFAVNSVAALTPKTGWRPDYYCIGDPDSFHRLKGLLNELQYQNVFVDINLKKYSGEMKFHPHWFDDVCWGVPYLDSPQRIRSNLRFSSDIYKYGVYTGRSITYTALQIAAYMGFSEIYIYGVDNGYQKGKSHFSQEGNPDDEKGIFDKPFMEKFCADNEISYEIADRYARKHGFRIYNATRGGAVKAFERADLDNVLERRG